MPAIWVGPPVTPSLSSVLQYPVPGQLNSLTRRVRAGRSDAGEERGERLRVGALGKLPEGRWRKVADWMTLATTKKCSGAEHRKAAVTRKASPLVLIPWAMSAIPLSELRVAVTLSRVAENLAVDALGATKRASLR
jgi:hypothetical protein